jgi:hypothetical protein
MSAEVEKPTSWWTQMRTAAVIVVAFLVIAGAWALISGVVEQRQIDRRTDEYYCTMSGIDPYDRGPETGELCIDLLGD